MPPTLAGSRRSMLPRWVLQMLAAPRKFCTIHSLCCRMQIWNAAYYSALVCITPFMNLYYHRLNLPESQIGILAALAPWIAAPAGELSWRRGLPDSSTAAHHKPCTQHGSACVTCGDWQGVMGLSDGSMQCDHGSMVIASPHLCAPDYAACILGHALSSLPVLGPCRQPLGSLCRPHRLAQVAAAGSIRPAAAGPLQCRPGAHVPRTGGPCCVH